MEQTVAIRFRWTANELLQAHRYHFRHTCRPVFRFGLHLFFGVVLLGGVLMLVTTGRSGPAISTAHTSHTPQGRVGRGRFGEARAAPTLRKSDACL